jgi:ABC-type uncharacterized transport system ATPase subunit
MTTDYPYLIEALSVRKVFGDLVALDDVTLRLRRGSFHALLGENGAGKSTLVKCMMGYYHPDEGQIMLDEREVEIDSPRDAHDLGIGMVYQHFTLIPNMTVAENLVLARPHLPMAMNWKKEIAQLKERMSTMPFQVPLEANVNSLAAGEKQKVEIMKQLLLDSRLLILDEPTSVLTPSEADEVLGRVRELVETRGLTVLIITHKFREVTGFADEVTILRKGRFVGSVRVADTDVKTMSEMMMGTTLTESKLERTPPPVNGTPVLTVDHLQCQGDKGETAVDDLSLGVRAGEIVGIAGISGNGQREFVEVLTGQREKLDGEIAIDGRPFTPDTKSIRQNRFHCLPEEPLRNACVPGMSVADNLALHVFHDAPYAWNRIFINRKAIRRRATELIREFRVKTESPESPIGTLSGGNVQRATLARELSEEVKVMVIANPCFGLDFNAVNEIHSRIMTARNQGSAVLMVSEDLDELLEMSDRLLVMSAGRLVYETTPERADRIEIGKFMAGTH